MTYKAKHPAAFINSIVEEGTKEEAIRWLQETWDELIEAKKKIIKLEGDIEEMEKDFET